MPAETVSIEFNGQSLDVSPETTIAQLLEAAQIRSHLVAVEINLEIIPREAHHSHQVHEGDKIEAVTLVGGG